MRRFTMFWLHKCHIRRYYDIPIMPLYYLYLTVISTLCILVWSSPNYALWRVRAFCLALASRRFVEEWIPVLAVTSLYSSALLWFSYNISSICLLSAAWRLSLWRHCVGCPPSRSYIRYRGASRNVSKLAADIGGFGRLPHGPSGSDNAPLRRWFAMSSKQSAI